jgi:hypothetical protein
VSGSMPLGVKQDDGHFFDCPDNTEL